MPLLNSGLQSLDLDSGETERFGKEYGRTKWLMWFLKSALEEVNKGRLKGNIRRQKNHLGSYHFGPGKPNEVWPREVVMGMEKKDVIGVEVARESC